MKQDGIHSETQWTKIHCSGNRFDLHCITDVYKYRFLILELTKKSIRSIYTQTLFGPLWLIIQPLFTSVVFVLVFQNVIGIPVQGSSSFVFYSSGVVLWGHFAKTVNAVSNIFISNRNTFSKLVFPKLVLPAAEILANLIKFIFQFVILIVVYLVLFRKSFSIISPVSILCFTAALLEVTVFAAGLGMVTASLTTVLKDMNIMIGYGTRLLFYATPILYPVNRIPDNLWKYLQFNPVAPAIDLFRFPLSGSLQVDSKVMWSGAVISMLFFIFGLVVFVVAQRSCIDKV